VDATTPSARVTVERDGVPADAIDGIVPDRVVEVGDSDQIAAVIGEARAASRAIVPVGGATDTAVGNVPERFDVALSLASMTRILAHEAENLTVTAEAGVSLAALNDVLAARGQRVVVDVDEPARATIGGIVATNPMGRRAYGFGSCRDLVVGLTVVDGRARTLRLGGKVVKNVAGFDLQKLFIGSSGTLGVISEVTLRTHPVPDVSSTLALYVDDYEAVESARAAIFASELPLAGFDVAGELGGERRRWRVEAFLEGTAEEVAHQRDRLLRIAPAEDGECEDSPAPGSAPSQGLLRLLVCVPPAACVDALRALASLAATRGYGGCVRGQLGLGRLRASVSSGDVEAASELIAAARVQAARLGGRIVVERAPVEVKRRLDVWGPPPSSIRLLRAVKDRFDPAHILSPGRYVGGI